VVNSMSRRLYPQERKPIPFEYKVGWALELVWTFWRIRKYLDPIGIQTMTLKSAV